MQNIERILGIVSNETKDQICKLDIVTPEIFTTTFLEFAKKHNLEEYSDAVEEYIQNKMANFLQIQDETTKKADKLSQTTSKAIKAIAQKNDSSLNEVLSETKKLRKELEKLKESLYKDELTGVYNRKWLFDYLVEEESNTFRDKGVLALIDLNYFKIVNDTYGHILGDKVLVFVANQLRKTKAKVVRYGGDEFLILFDSLASQSGVRQKLKDLREDMLKKHLKAKDAEFRISFSLGVMEFAKGDKLDEVVDCADKDMYDDKIAIKKRIKGIHI